MIEAFFITMREGLEIALVVGVMASVLRSRGESHLWRTVLWGLGAGLALSAFTGWSLVSLLARWLNGEIFESAMYFSTAAFVAIMAVWVARTARHLKRLVAERLDATASSGWALAVMTGLLVWREGTEVVLMLHTASQAGGVAHQLVGVAAGAAAASVVGWQLVRGSSQLPMASIMRVSAVVLWALVGLFFMSGVHELAESGAIRVSHVIWTGIGFVALHGWALLLGGLLLAIGVEWFRAKRVWHVPSCAAVAGALVMVWSWMGGDQVQAAPTMLSVTDGAFVFPVASVSERAAWFAYPLPEGGARRLLSIRRPDGVIVAFDTCQNCFSEKGYRQEREELICTHCGAESVPASIGSGLKSCMPAYAAGPFRADKSAPQLFVDRLEAAYREWEHGGEW